MRRRVCCCQGGENIAVLGKRGCCNGEDRMLLWLGQDPAAVVRRRGCCWVEKEKMLLW